MVSVLLKGEVKVKQGKGGKEEDSKYEIGREIHSSAKEKREESAQLGGRRKRATRAT